MGCLVKVLALVLILCVTISSLIMLTVKPAGAQTIGSLATPVFTVSLTNTSYSTPPSHYVDPQTGANITVPGSFVNRENLTFTVQNQPNVTFYTIRWTTRYMTSWNYIEGSLGGDPMNATLERTSGSTTNLVLTGIYGSYPIYDLNGSFVATVYGYSFSFGSQSLNFESGAKIEFQVQASNGSPHQVITFLQGYNWIVGDTSDWSSTQTVTIPAGSTSLTSAIPELSWLVIVPLILFVQSLAMIIRHGKEKFG